jgi:hypothetical protein
VTKTRGVLRACLAPGESEGIGDYYHGGHTISDEREAGMWRQRWPLLVAAKGWGEWVRPPQGTASLDFPVYAATWYDDKALGYYNYITGGRDGGAGMEGGGIRVGGAMCAGRFDGGNCVAAVIRESSNNNGGGGGWIVLWC